VLVAAGAPTEETGIALAQVIERLDDRQEGDSLGIGVQPEPASAAPSALNQSGGRHDLQDLREKRRRDPELEGDVAPTCQAAPVARPQLRERTDRVLG
jgi:hypothetical protein